MNDLPYKMPNDWDFAPEWGIPLCVKPKFGYYKNSAMLPDSQLAKTLGFKLSAIQVVLLYHQKERKNEIKIQSKIATRKR
jgi:hypothetical protein